MNYSQFLLMMPEATLVAIMIIVFFADLLMKGEQKAKSLGVLTALLLCVQLVPCFLANPEEAFGGMYVTSAAVNVMKVILTAGTLIVVVMAQTWLSPTNQSSLTSHPYSGEFYTLIVSTLLGTS